MTHKKRILLIEDEEDIAALIKLQAELSGYKMHVEVDGLNGYRAIEREKPDLVLTGLQSEDQGFGQTGVLLAELLGLPHATIIMQIEAKDAGLRVKRELEAGWFQWVELPLPAMLTIQSGINKVRYATLKGIMAAKKKEIATITRESLGVAHEPTQHIERIYVPSKTKKTEFLTGTPKEVATKLVEKLKFEARVI